MNRFVTIGISLVLGGLAYFFLPIANLQAAVQPLVVFLSIMAAALLVRLNRGLPGIDWKLVEPEDRKQLTRRLVEISHEYAAVLALQFLLLIGLLALVASGPAERWPCVIADKAGWIVGVTLGLIAMSATRMAYVVWRDLDIVHLQKAVLDKIADREAHDDEVRVAQAKVDAMKAAKLPK
jgi:hypothetical protein